MPGTDSADDAKNPQQYDIRDRSPTLAVLESVARFKQTDPLDLVPLAYYVDPEALDRLIESENDVAVRFTYDDVVVDIASSGAITVAERDGWR